MRKTPIHLLLTLVFLILAAGWFLPLVVGARQLSAYVSHGALNPNKPRAPVPSGQPYTPKCKDPYCRGGPPTPP
ncbi:hypothetical protein Cni_G15507 [Canna indica]|uniref:Uncharacterized protein n=1 Tax=Canna indica TaxID=4628 RepID=A0AAQ3KH44_9LILI|nr:hypothetical protein Cni_G15507 [Canna indica]